MKFCNDCEAIFGEHYATCPSCKGTNLSKYEPAERNKETDDLKSEPICPFVEFTELTDFEAE